MMMEHLLLPSLPHQYNEILQSWKHEQDVKNKNKK